MSNLVSNALKHGAPSSAVGVSAEIVGDQFQLVVSNIGAALAPEVAQHLFEP